MATVVNMDTVV
ncbi:m153R [Myxoma virus]|nr:m153R [Myxoma virus]QAV37338.1 m153R [Myxoma virus]QAV37676.1 m153R [Myxoma virus]QAV38690.1 m153R [Myxoma virus]QAV39197.1 m153R [Myxoma virus]